jgi:WD40 repeat protein
MTVAAIATAALLVPAPASAEPPTAVWSAPGLATASFSVDGTLAVLTANSSAGGRLEIRQAATGALVRAVTSPEKFGAATLSADRQIAAVTLNDTSSGLTVRTIRLYRVSDGAPLRSIPTAATRDLTSVDLSPDGRYVAAMDRRSYEQGGRVHVHRVTDGATVTVLTAEATTAAVRFSPDGRYLAANTRLLVGGRFVAAVRVFRTSDWSTVLTAGDGALLVRWSPDSAGIWTATIVPGAPTSAQLLAVPAGTVRRSVALAQYDTVADVTDDGELVLTGRAAAPRRSLTFTDTVTGGPAATYDFGSDVFAGDISPDGTLFTYTLSTSGGYTVEVAKKQRQGE